MMRLQALLFIASLLFFCGALLHLGALVFGWPIVFYGWTLPVWANSLSFLVGSFLSYQTYRASKLLRLK